MQLIVPRVEVFGGEEALALQEKTVDARNVMTDTVQLAMRICSRHEPPERALSSDSGAGLPPDAPGTVSDRKAILNMNEVSTDDYSAMLVADVLKSYAMMHSVDHF